ncbi:hypothetical protein GYMLUDRAFT_878005 [Collybiopsis luxurians FD-317 M1]|nr:hypothetical protein GYMLUDRAFT_878005 [Collybiopsis luxurians FD-317 M1]
MYYDPTHSPSRSHNSNHNNTHTRTTTRAADIGQGGRRQGGGPSDYDGEVGDKDELPAYDKYGGPPGYIDSLHLPVLHSASQSSQEREQERDREPAPGYSPEERH